MTTHAGAKVAEIELPCGYLDDDGELYDTMTVREMMDAEEVILGSKKGDVLHILRNCIVQCGPYHDRASIVDKVFPELLKGDGDWAMVNIRRLSITDGDVYPFKAICPRCGKQGSFTFDLSTVELIRMPDPGARVISYTTRTGKVLKFRFPRMADSAMMTQIAKDRDNAAAKLLAMVLLSVDDEPVKTEKTKTEMSVLNNALKIFRAVAPAYSEREDIRLLMKSKIGKPDLAVISECEECGCEWSHNMPVDVGFLRPSLVGE